MRFCPWDTQLEDEIALLRRNLLRLTHTPEFSEAAVFQVCLPSFVCAWSATTASLLAQMMSLPVAVD